MLIRAVEATDAPELATLLNEIIGLGGTTAFQKPFTADQLAEAWLIGPSIIGCFVAESDKGTLEGFQMLARSQSSPADIAEIGTFARVGGNQKGVGTNLFSRTRREAANVGLIAIHATIRADNIGGLTFYERMGFVDHAVCKSVPLEDGTLVDRIVKRYLVSPSAGSVGSS